MQTGSNFEFECVARDSKESKFLDSVEVGGVRFSLESVIRRIAYKRVSPSDQLLQESTADVVEGEIVCLFVGFMF